MPLRLRGVSLTYGADVRALSNITLTVSEGICGLLGEAGAGKSSLMRVLAALQHADSGRIHFRGVDFAAHADHARHLVGYVPQEPCSYPNVPAEVLLLHTAALRGISYAGARRAVVEAVLRQTRLWDARKIDVGYFSDGMQMRLAVALALLGNPGLLLIDTQPSNLPRDERDSFITIVRELRYNRVVMLAAAVADDVAAVCERVVIIDRGRVAGDVMFTASKCLEQKTAELEDACARVSIAALDAPCRARTSAVERVSA